MENLPAETWARESNEYLKEADWALNLFAFQIGLVKQEAYLQPICMTDCLGSSPLGHQF